MAEKCEHATSIVLLDLGDVSLDRCTWGCGQILVEVSLGNHMVATFTVDELVKLAKKRAEQIGDKPGVCSHGYDMGV